MAYIGQTLTEGIRRAYTFLATSGQTTFNAVYGVGSVDVFQNGILLQPSDYTATTGTTVVLGVGAAVNDEITILAHSTFHIADVVSAAQGGTFSGDVSFEGNINRSSGNLVINSQGQDNDIQLKGNDGGSTITALSLDMSEAGYANFNSGGNFNGNLTVNGSNGELLTVNSSSGTELKVHVDGNEVSFRVDGDNDEADSVMTFDIDNTEAFRIDTGGNLAFKNSTAYSQFFFQSDANSKPDWITAGTGNQAGSTDCDADAIALYVGPEASRNYVTGNYIAGIAFDHLLNHSTTNPFGYSTGGGPHCWMGMRMVSSAARELSALVFATRGGTGATDKCLERMAVTPNGKVLIGSEGEVNSGVRISNGGINVSDGTVNKTYANSGSIPQSAIVIPVTDGTNTTNVGAGGGWANIGWATGARSGEQMHRNTGNPYMVNGSGTACGFYIEAGTGEAGGICLDEDGTQVYGSSDMGTTFRIIDKDSDVVVCENTHTSWNWNVRGSVNSNASMSSISDQRLKKSFQDETNPNILTDFASLQLKSYIRVDSRDYMKGNFENEEELREVGLVAQEVEAVFPDCVGTTPIVDPRGWDSVFEEIGETLTETKNVNINGLLYKTMQTVQKLIEENTALKARVSALEGD
tara:strand:+ start:9914 stop:11824 length:1911 start_codon:yes stop_codon:yes gene_type:complete